MLARAGVGGTDGQGTLASAGGVLVVVELNVGLVGGDAEAGGDGEGVAGEAVVGADDVVVEDLDRDLVGAGVGDGELEGLVPLGVDRLLDGFGLELLIGLTPVADKGDLGVWVTLPVHVRAFEPLRLDDLEHKLS